MDGIKNRIESGCLVNYNFNLYCASPTIVNRDWIWSMWMKTNMKKTEMIDKKHCIPQISDVLFSHHRFSFTIWTTYNDNNASGRHAFPFAISDNTNAYNSNNNILELFIYWTLMAPWVNTHSNTNCIYRI